MTILVVVQPRHVIELSKRLTKEFNVKMIPLNVDFEVEGVRIIVKSENTYILGYRPNFILSSKVLNDLETNSIDNKLEFDNKQIFDRVYGIALDYINFVVDKNGVFYLWEV